MRHRFQKRTIGVFAALVLASCFGDSTGPGELRLGRIAVAPVFDAQAARFVDIDRVRVLLTRAGGDVALDTVVVFPAADTILQLALAVRVASYTETFDLYLRVIDDPAGDTVFVSGPTRVVVVAGTVAPQPVTPQLYYAGVGANATGIRFVQAPATVSFGDSATFAAEALDGGGAPIPGTPILYRVSDTTRAQVPDDAQGLVVAKTTRGSVTVTAALLPTSPAPPPSVGRPLLVQPVPAAIRVQNGNNQAGTVGVVLPSPVTARVLAADSLGVQGVIVTFAVAAGGGTLSALVDTTDASGDAAVTWTLGTAPGAQSVTATAIGVSASTAAFAATAAAGAARRLVFTTPPSAVNAGFPITPAVVVAAQDTFGNTAASFTGPVTVALGANPGGAVLGGTTAVNAVAGVATFSTLALSVPSPGYTLIASATGVTSAVSASFPVQPNLVPTRLQIDVQPTTVAAGSAFAPAIVVSERDNAGNIVGVAADTITLALGANPTGDTLQGTVKVLAVNGVATFSGAFLRRAGTGYTITASASVPLTTATSTAFTVSAGPTAALAVAVGPPAAVPAGAPIAPTLQIRVVDAFGNPVLAATDVVTLAIATNPGGDTLQGAVSVPASGGVASFAAVSLRRAGAGYTLVASAPGLTPVTTAAFTVVAGTPAALAFGQQPIPVSAGAGFAPPVTVEVRDAFGNLATGATDTVRLALAANPGADTLQGATSAVAVGGVATFPAVSLRRAATGYTVAASATGRTGATSAAFDVTAGPAASLQFTTPPPASVIQGAPFTVAVAARDAFGNAASAFAGAVTVALGANPGGSNLSGPTTVAASGGLASFTGLSLDQGGTGYTLTAAATGVTGSTSAPFDVVVVTSWDGATDFSSSANPNGAWTSGWTATLGSALTVYPHPVSGGGFEGWDDLAIINLGTPSFAKNVSGSVLQGVAPGQVTLHPGCNALEYSELRWTAPVAGSYLASVQFFAGNVGNTDAAVVVNNNAPAFTAASTGVNPSYSAFLSLAAGDRLRFTVGTGGDGCFSDATPLNVAIRATSAVTLTANAPTSQSATTGTAVAAPPSVIVRDGANVPVAGVSVTFGVTVGGGILTGATAVTDVSGVATAGSWVLGAVPGANAVDAGLAGATSVTFNATGLAPAATQLTFTSVPASVPSGTSFTAVVEARDAGGALVPGFTGAVALAIGTNPAGGTLSGVTTVNAVGGVATFTSVSIDNVGTGYTLTATAAGLTAATSNAFDVTASAGNNAWINPGGGTWSTSANWSRGVVPVAGDTVLITLAGTYTVTMDVNASIARLSLGGATGNQTLVVPGGGTLTLTGPTASVINVTGQLAVAGAIAGTSALDNQGAVSLSGGTIGNALSNPGSFIATGTATLNGALTLPSPGVLTVSSGTLTVNAGASGTGDWGITSGALDLRGGGTLGGTTALGAAGTLTIGGGTFTYGVGSSIAGPGSVTVNAGTLDLAGSMNAGGLAVTGGQFSLNNATAQISGNLTTSGSGTIAMSHALDTLIVVGDASLGGGSTTGLLTGGMLRVGGNFSQSGAASAFAPSGTHLAVLDGSGAQVVGFADAVSSSFRRLEVNKGAGGVTLATNVRAGWLRLASATAVTGPTARLVTDTIIGPSTGSSLTPLVVEVSRVLGDSGALSPDTLVFNGSGATQTLLDKGDLSCAACPTYAFRSFRAANAANVQLGVVGLTFANDLVVSSGRLLMGGTRATVTGNFRTEGTGGLQTTVAAESLTVVGNATFAGGSTAGFLTGGKLSVGGNVTQSTTATAFQASGTHVTALNGTGTQTISFAHPAASGSSNFAELRLNKASGSVALATDVFAAGQLSRTAGSVTVTSSNAALTVQGANASNITFDNTRLIIESSAAIGTFDNITFQNMDQAATQLALTRSSGTFTFNGLAFGATTSGRYVQADGPILVTVSGASPAAPGSFVNELNGAVVVWNSPGSNVFTNTAGGNWNVPGNWSKGSVPSATDTVVIRLGGTYAVTLNVNATPARLDIGGSGGIQTLDVSGGSTLTFGAGSHLLRPASRLTGAGAVVVGSGPVTVDGPWSHTGSTQVSGGTLTYNAATGGTGGLTVSSGTLGGNGVFEVSGAMTWSGGALSGGTGVVRVLGSGSLAITGGPKSLVSYGLEHASSTGSWTSGNISTGSGGRLTVLAGGALTVSASVGFNHTLGGPIASITNRGTLTVSGGRLLGVQDSLDNTGTINLTGADTLRLTGSGYTARLGGTVNLAGATGALEFSGPTVAMLGGLTVGGSGKTRLGSGILNAPAGDSVAFGDLEVSGGTLGGGGVVRVGGALSWLNGSLDGPVVTRVLPGATLSIAGTTPQLRNGHVLEFDGASGTWSTGNISTGSGSQLLVRPTRTLTVTGDVAFARTFGGAATSIVNQGTIQISGGSTLTMSDSMLNTGILDVTGANDSLRFISSGYSAVLGGTVNVGSTSGALEVNGPVVRLAPGFSATGSGPTLVRLGSLIAPNGDSASFDRLEVLGGGLSGVNSVVRVSTLLNWTGGTLSGSNTTRLLPTASLVVDSTPGAPPKILQGGHRLDFDGASGSWQAGNISTGGGSQLVVRAGRTLAVTADVRWTRTFGGTATAIVNNGTLAISGGSTLDVLDSLASTGAITLAGANDTLKQRSTTAAASLGGTLAVPAGAAMEVNGQVVNLQAGFAMSGTGVARLVSGTINGPTLDSAAFSALTVSGGTLGGTNSVVRVGSAFNWSGGALDGNSTTRVLPGAVLTMSGAAKNLSNGALLEVGSSAGAWSGGNIQGAIGGRMTVLPGATLNVTGDVSFFRFTVGAANSIANAGTLAISGGSTLTMSDSLNSTGAITLAGANDSLKMTAIGTTYLLSGTATAGTGSAIVGTGGTLVLSNDLAVSGAGRFALTSGLLNMNGRTLSLGGDFATSGTGSLVMNNPADSLDVSGNITFGGAASTLSNGVIRVAGDVTQVGTTNNYAPTAVHRMVLGGSASQSVTFGTTTNSFFRRLDINKSAGTVTLASNVRASRLRMVSSTGLAGLFRLFTDTVTSGNVGHTITPLALEISSVLADSGGTGFAPDTTVFTGVAPTIPRNAVAGQDYAWKSIRVSQQSGVALAGGRLVLANDLVTTVGLLDVNGQAVLVGGNYRGTGGGGLRMDAGADSVGVIGNATFGGSAVGGLLTAGVLSLRGDLTQTGTTTYAAGSTHVTELAGANVQTVSFATPAASGGSNFGVLRLAKTGGSVNLATAAFASGQLTTTASGTISSTDNVLTVQGVNASGVTFDNTRLVIGGGAALGTFNNITFQNMNTTVTQLDITRSGTGSFTFSGHSYATTPSIGRYLSLNAPAGFILTMAGASPASGSSLSTVLGGATLNW